MDQSSVAELFVQTMISLDNVTKENKRLLLEVETLIEIVAYFKRKCDEHIHHWIHRDQERIDKFDHNLSQ